MVQDRDERPAGQGYGVGYAIVGAGFQLAFSILFFFGLGWWADRRLGTHPVLMLVGLAIGLAAGMYAFLRRVSHEAGAGSRGSGTRGKTET